MTQKLNVTSRTVSSYAWADTYREVAVKAQFVRETLENRGIILRNGSALFRLLKQAHLLSEAWDRQSEADPTVLCEAAHVNRLADAVKALQLESGIQEALQRMASSVMQSDDRTMSQGKDALWEIALLADFRKAKLTSRAAEPDIIVDCGFGDYPVACKKIWSEKGVANQVRSASRQLRPFQNGGIIALNLDDLVPAGRVLIQEFGRDALQFLNFFNKDFVDRHRYVLQRAIFEMKCDGFIVSTTTPAVLIQELPPFNLITQNLFWNIKEATSDSLSRFNSFAQRSSER
ncbi:hypothetical protein [Agrobacterium vaccinii]|uniref:hypothetical protein n=1 Tax=Agrobacterium vaccinii TaxID=2735528 RepID=UPI001E5A0B45|nr:hypothetical protein [Agrobacterium vaccinii]UHS59984.1 hypothetical protein HRS00_23995 [Agrobacterium vaccinii]